MELTRFQSIEVEVIEKMHFPGPYGKTAKFECFFKDPLFFWYLIPDLLP